MSFVLAIASQGNVADSTDLTLPANFAISVSVPQEIRADDIKAGERVTIVVSNDAHWRGCLVFRAGDSVIGSVMVSEVERTLGKPSRIVIRLESCIAADGSKVAITGMIGSEGKDRSMEAIGAAAGICCLGLFLKGEKKSIAAGVGVTAFTRYPTRVRCAPN